MEKSENLKTLVERYGSLKAEMDSFKQQVDADNKAIKDIMSEEGISEFTAGGFTAKYSITVSESFDDEKLVAKLKELWFKENGSKTNPYLKLTWVPDMNAIENAIYNGKLNAADLAPCRVTKKTPRLLIRKAK